MYLMYVDESGDSGLINSPTRYFVLTGLVIHELRWRQYLEQIIDFRKRMKQLYSLKLREELHGAAFISHPGDLIRIKRYDRLAIIREFAAELSSMHDINLINIVVDKQGKSAQYDVFEAAWKALIQRFENTLSHRNFTGPANPDDRGIIFCDHTDDKKLKKMLRKMHQYNPVPNHHSRGEGYRNLPLSNIIEDPSFRDSRHSYFVQATDLASFLLYQKIAPSLYMKKKSGNNYFSKLDPILCRVASSSDPDGIVRL